MLEIRWLRTAVFTLALIGALLLPAGSAFAAPADLGSLGPGAAWTWLQDTASVVWARTFGPVAGYFAKDGPCIDPNGSPCSQGHLPTGSPDKDGPCIDPNGSPCDNGSSAPPPPPSGQDGPCIDPNGKPCASSLGPQRPGRTGPGPSRLR